MLRRMRGLSLEGMSGLFRQNQVTIDLGAIRQNYLLMQGRVGQNVRVMAVVKANAYGHGIVEVARTIEAAGGGDLAVAIPEEGIQLREAGIRANILVLGAATEVAAEASILNDLTLTVFEPYMVAVLEEAASRLGKPALVHIKLDTGMNRIGLRTGGEADALAVALQQAPHVQVKGIYTHFADADNPGQSGGINAYTQKQLEAFRALKAHFDPSIPAHASNSAMSLVSPEADFSLIREGISLYGYPPVKTDLPFRPALRWEAEVVYVKDIAAGESVGYGLHIHGRAGHAHRHRSRRLWRRLPPRGQQPGADAGGRQAGQYRGPYLHGSDHGGCDGRGWRGRGRAGGADWRAG